MNLCCEMVQVTTGVIFLVLMLARCVDGIGCFKCSSTNRDNPECEDRFNASSAIYESDCMAGRKGRAGLFPSSSCIKVSAQNDETGETIVIRDCVVDNGGTTSDTEISRTTHCGWVDRINYQGVLMRGCVLTCYNDGCNAASGLHSLGGVIVGFLVTSLSIL